MKPEEGLRLQPVTDGRTRPRWSVLIPVFNCARYLEEALSSVLAQDPGQDEMEIIVVDDHSTKDDPEDVVRRVGGSRVRFIRQPQNVGKARNYETGLLASRGHLIHQLHGDDRVLEGFYDSMERAFETFPSAGAFFCESRYIDESGGVTGRTGRLIADTGIIDGWLEKIVVAQRVQTPSIVVRRTVYETLGGFDRRLDVLEDWEMWIRLGTLFPVGFLAETLADYRVSSGNSTTTSIIAGTRVATLRTMLRIVDEYLPPDVLSRCRSERSRELAQYLIQFIPALMSRGELRGVARIFRDTLSFSRDPRTVYRLVNYTLFHRRLLAYTTLPENHLT